MGWAVGWDFDHRRWMGYGVPAYCDAGCRTEIDRGLDRRCTCGRHGDALDSPTLFVCSNHTCADVDEDKLPSEHPDWIRHLLSDESWAQWRSENPLEAKQIAELI